MGKSKKTKPFIDKKSATTYHLLHRSQRDVANDVLLADDGNAIDEENGNAALNAGRILWAEPKEDDEDEQQEKQPAVGEQGVSKMAEWRQRLSSVGLLEEGPDAFLKPVSGTGSFLEGPSKGAAAAVAARSLVLQEEVLEVDRVMDSIPLTADCMDEEIALALFGDHAWEDGNLEEIQDDFVLQAAQEPEDDDEDNAASNQEAFDYDEHIRKLMESARREAAGGPAADLPTDANYFEGLVPLHERDEDDDDEMESVLVTPGVVAKLSPEEERALCEKFEATLAEYDSDEVGDVPEEYVGGHRPLEGDALLDEALSDFLQDRKDEILIQGNRHYLEDRRTGGSGFAALVGKNMVHASHLPGAQDNDDDGPAPPVQEVLAQATQRLALPPVAPPAEDVLIDGQSYYSQRERNPFDCESILSTYSNLDNNPVTLGPGGGRRRRRKAKPMPVEEEEEKDEFQEEEPVQQIKLSSKTGLPIGVLPPRRYNDNEDDFHDNSTMTSVNRGVARNKHESLAEKKARKAASKQERLLARIQKKVTKEVYAEEFSRQTVAVGHDVAGKTVFRFS